MCIVHDVKQGSPEWEELRLSIPTASEFDQILTPAKLEPSKSSVGYLRVKIAEWLYGAPLETFISPWMDRGTALEPEAVRYYEMEKCVDTQAVGFVTTDDGMIGASPDRFVGSDGNLELKAPSLAVHVGYLLDPKSLVDQYRLQVQGQLWVCERDHADIMSYFPGFPSPIVRVQRDEKVIEALEKHVPTFVETMLACRVKLTQMYGELRRERVTAAERTAASHAAFDSFMESGIGGAV